MRNAVALIYVIFSSLFFSVAGGEFSLNYYEEYTPQIAYGYASNDSLDYRNFRIAIQDFSSSIDSFIALEEQVVTVTPGEASPLAAKDSVFLESNHTGDIAHAFVFDLREVFSIIGEDTDIEQAILKYSIHANTEAGGNTRIHWELPQCGHYWLWRDFSDSEPFSQDTVDSQSILAHQIGGISGMMQYDMVLILETDRLNNDWETSKTTLQTDYIEIILVTDQQTHISLKPKQINTVPNFSVSPFSDNSKIKISYSLAVNEHVSMDIFSLSGKLIYSLDQGMQQPGTYSIVWNRQNGFGHIISNKKYLLRFNTEEKSYSQLITLW